LPALTAINNSEKNVENKINILNDNSAVANGKTTKPTVSESVVSQYILSNFIEI